MDRKLKYTWFLPSVAMAICLTGCNSNDDPLPAKSGGPDSFTLQVQSKAAAAIEDAEPQDIDSVALVQLEDAEPASVN